MRVRLLAVVCCLVLAGCAAPAAPSPTPGEDRLGWEDGYAATDSVAVDASDGLNESELDAVVARTMARVELIRGLEFEETVPVEVISREEFRNGSSRDTTSTRPPSAPASSATRRRCSSARTAPSAARSARSTAAPCLATTRPAPTASCS
ncbi:hypothetical protein [Halolamina rubra]|uniref:hypothetical protein n=1 Tax=Halolamina rubra TaxID=1380430 RepID=UPI001F19694D|nr:hypothetical protein [Halolamina rubra]